MVNRVNADYVEARRQECGRCGCQRVRVRKMWMPEGESAEEMVASSGGVQKKWKPEGESAEDVDAKGTGVGECGR